MKVKLSKVRKETDLYEMDKLRGLTWELKDGCSERMCMASLKIVADCLENFFLLLGGMKASSNVSSLKATKN